MVNFKINDVTDRTTTNYNTENQVGRLIPDLVLFYKKALYEVKASGQLLSFNIFWYPDLLVQ